MLLVGRERMNAGEARPIYVEVDAGRNATLQVLSTETIPAGEFNPSYRLLDSDGEEISTDFGMGFTEEAVQKPNVWVVPDASVLVKGASYVLVVKFQAQGSGEDFVRTYDQAVGIYVSAGVEV